MDRHHHDAQTALAATVPAGAAVRPDQLACVTDLLAGRRVVCVQATGWGKSTVYFAATRALRARGLGPSIVITPLLALMRDQVAAAERAGLHAASINSANRYDWDTIWEAVTANAIDIVFISPERLAAVDPDGRLAALSAAASLLVVDEAHCISDWGHDFRPDYRRLAATVAASRAVVLATTATANQRVTDDIATQLGADTVTYRGPLARASLRLSVVADLDAAAMYAWCANAVATWADEGRTGIVYVPVIADTTRVTDWLAAQGLRAAAYSGALDAATRAQVEDDLRAGQLDVVVATSALGMGYDHPALGFVVHLGSPGSPVAYYQQIGRAGRAIDAADIVLVPTSGDHRLWEYFATAAVPDPDQGDQVLAALAEGATSAIAIERTTGIRRGRVELLLKTLAVDGAADRGPDGWYATGVAWHYDADHYRDLVAARRAETAVMQRYAASEACLMATLQHALDDPSATDCSRCAVCVAATGPAAERPSADEVTAARRWLKRRAVPLPSRKRWPAGTRRGAIEGAEDGYALTDADDPVWADDLAAWHKNQIPAGLVDAGADLVAQWGITPDTVVAVAGLDHRAGHYAAQLAERLGVGVTDAVLVDAAVDLTSDGAAGETSTAQVTRLLDAVQATGPITGVVLVVVDTWRTGWTATVAAAELRAAGATRVHVLAVTRRP